MSLRSKILVLFFLFALGPLLVVGIYASRKSLQQAELLAEARVARAGELVALEVVTRYASAEAALNSLADAYVRGGAQAVFANGIVADFNGLEVRDGGGATIEVLGDPIAESSGACGDMASRVTIAAERVLGTEPGGRAVMVGQVLASRLFRRDELIPDLGQNGYTLIVDRMTGRAVYDPLCLAGSGGTAMLSTADGPISVTPEFSEGSGQFRFDRGATERVAFYVNLTTPEWTVIASTFLADYTAYERQNRVLWIIWLSFVAVAALGAFGILLMALTRELGQLTTAAGRIGDGDFTPWLPPPTRDEVGQLSLAFGRMVARIRAMMGQLDKSRRMAVIGELTSHLSHEIRNPLSSIKLNLQSLDREARAGGAPPDLPDVLRLCLREIKRLDKTVNDVLLLGRPSQGRATDHSLAVLLSEALAVIAPRLRQRGIDLETWWDASPDVVSVDADQVSGAFINLYLNAADVMKEGGTLRVWTDLGVAADGTPMARAHILDEGPGIPPELRERVFEPFFTTKRSGSGIGLALAQQAIEAQGGLLYLEQRSELERGAHFVVALPLAQGSKESGPPDEATAKLLEEGATRSAGEDGNGFTDEDREDGAGDADEPSTPAEPAYN